MTAINGTLTAQATESITVELKPENVRLKSGYVVLGITDEDTYLARYFEELPTGMVDITEKATAFQTIFPLSIQNGAIFAARTDGSAGFEKIGINGNQEFVQDGIISTVSSESFSLRVRDSEFGVFHDRNDPNVINTFNPTTMEVTGSIDMTLANELDSAAVRYQTYIFRGDNEMFVPTRLEAGGNLPDVSLPKVTLSAGAATAVAQLDGGGDLVVLNRFGQRYVDESGNLYFFHAGNINIPTISGAIVRINAGEDDYDPNYYFEAPVVNNPGVTGFGSFMSSFYYYKDNIGYVLVNEELDPRIAQLIGERGGTQNLTGDDIQLITFWLFTSPTGAWVQVNLVDQSVTKLTGLPPLSVFDASGMTFVGGTPHFAVANPNVNAFFRLDEATGNVEKLFDMTGANIVGVYDLSIDE